MTIMIFLTFQMILWGHAATLSFTLLVQLFADYRCPWVQKQFGLPYSLLLDTIYVFHSSLSQSDLVLRFPGADEELICE